MARKVDQESPEGRALQAEVQKKLRQYLGQEYSDDVLPLYIVVMLAHGNNEALVTENLQAFLGDTNSADFSAWLFRLMEEQGERFTVPVVQAVEEEPPAPVTAAVARAAPESEDRSRRRERTRDKIEWKEDKAAGAAPRERGDERERADRDRGRDRERAKDPAGDEYHQRDTGERDRRRREKDVRAMETSREPRVSGHRHEERERRPEREHRERERPREYERERERPRLRDLDPERERDRPRIAAFASDEGRERGTRHMDRDQAADARKSSPGRPAARGRKDVEMVPEVAEEVPTRGQDRRRAGASRPAKASPPKRVLADALRSAGVGAPPPEAPRASVLTRLSDKRPRGEESEPEPPQPKKAAAPTSVFDRLAGVKVPVQRATAPRPLDNSAGPKDAEMADAAPHASVFTRVSKPADGLGARAPAFALANGNGAALGNGNVNSAGNDQVPNQATQEDQASVRAQLEEMRAQLAELQRQQALASAARNHRCVVVNLLDPRITSEIVAAHFAGAGLPTLKVEIQRDPFGHSTGTAVVEMATDLAAQTALALSGSRLLEKPISVLPKIDAMQTYGVMGTPMPMGGGVFSPAPQGLPMPGGPPFGGPPMRPGGVHPGHMGRLRNAPPLGSSPFAGRIGVPGGRGRGRMPLMTNKYIRPELREEMAKKKADDREAAVAKLDEDLDRLKSVTMDVCIV